MLFLKTGKQTRLVQLATALLISVFCLSATRVPSVWAEAVRRYHAAAVARMSGKWQDALREMNAVAAVYPTSAVVHYELAQVAARAGDSRSAFIALSHALRLGYHSFLQDDEDLRSLRSASEWPDLSRKYEAAEKRWRVTHGDPNRVAIHTEDIRRFWHTWDRAQNQPAAEWPSLFIRN